MNTPSAWDVHPTDRSAVAARDGLRVALDRLAADGRDVPCWVSVAFDCRRCPVLAECSTFADLNSDERVTP